MAKGNLFLGTSTGKVGDIVTYRKHGTQITRAYNPSPSNPRTDKQMLRRVRWASLQPAYASNKNLITQTFTNLVGNTSAQRQFYKANFYKTNLVAKEQNEFYKVTNIFTPARYCISKGNLAFFPESILYKFENAGGESPALTLHLNVNNVLAYIEHKAGNANEVFLNLGEFINATFYNTIYSGERIGIVTTRVEQEDYFNTFVCTPFNYYESTNLLFNEQPIKFIKNGNSWTLDNESPVTIKNLFDSFDIYFTANESAYITHSCNATAEGFGFACFRVRPRDKSVSDSLLTLNLSGAAQAYITYLQSEEALKYAIESYRNEPVVLSNNSVING